jgi:hypothetical protein
MDTMTTTATTAATQPPRPLHSALHFEPDFASAGVIDFPRKAMMVTRRPDQLPVRVLPEKSKTTGEWHAAGRTVYPAPGTYAPLAGRWNPVDVTAFCKDGAAPGFAECLTAIREELTRHVEFTRSETASLAACWTVATYFHPLFTTFPRLNVTGPKRAGKSKLLQVIACIAFNGLHQVSPTPATLFRLIEPLRPTLCLDEMEQLDGPEMKAIKAILNAGYKAGATVPRTEGDVSREVVPYHVYGPVALAGIRGLDDVLADRSISVLMQRGKDKALVNSEVDPADPVWAGVRAKCYRLTLTHWPQVLRALHAVRARQDSFKVLEGRPLELYRPLLAVGVLARAEGDDSFLSDLSTLVRDDAEAQDPLEAEAMRLFAELERRLRIASAPFITVSPSELVGTAAPPEQVGKLLKRYGFPGRRTKTGSVYTITREYFLEQAKRYGYPADLKPQPTSDAGDAW